MPRGIDKSTTWVPSKRTNGDFFPFCRDSTLQFSSPARHQHVSFPGPYGYDIWKLAYKLKMLAGAHKVLVNAATLDQILVATSFHDRPVIHDHDQVGMKNRKSVRNTYRRTAFHEFIERRLNGAFGLRIKCTRGLVKDEDGCAS